MTKKIEFPKKLFVYKFYEGTENECLVAYETERECADIEEDRLVGVYELKEVGTLQVSVVLSKK